MFDEIIGLDQLKVIHANDSLKKFGSHADRHAHIGEGEIGMTAFHLLINDPRMHGKAIVVETPDAETMHEVNVKRLRDLIGADAPAVVCTSFLLSERATFSDPSYVSNG